MPPFVVWGTTSSIVGDFANNTHVAGSPRDGIATSGDGDIDNNPSGTSSELGYAGIPNATGIYGLRTLTFSDGGTAVWGGGSGGGFVIPTNATAYNTLLNGTAFTVTAQPGISSIAYTALYMPPPPSGNAAPTLGGTLTFVTAEEDVASAIDLSGYNISDVNNDTVTLTLAVNSGTIASTDGNGLFAGVTVAGSGTTSMTLQGSAASLNAYLNILTKITFTTTLNSTASATLTVTPNDGTLNGTADTVTISVTPVNDAPTINTGTATIPTTNEDTSATAIVSSLLTDRGFADVDSGGSSGMAITGVTGNGTWQFTTNSALGWTDFGAVSNASSLLLGSTTSVRYVPDGIAGETATFTFRGWDQTTGTASNFGSAQKAASTATGGSNAFSTAEATASLTVTDVNDAPTITTGTTNYTGVDEDTDSAALLVSTLISNRGFADVDTGNAEGMAVTATTGSGTWEFSIDGTSGWTAFGAVSGASSLLLAEGTSVRYVPDGANAETATFSYRGWDQTSGAASSTGSAQKVSSATNGGSSAFSANVATASIVVSGIDDAPTLTATGGDPDHQGGAPSDLFETVTADTVDTGQTFASLTMTISNLADGADETMVIDGSTVALTDGSTVASTITNGLAVSVSVTTTTATVSITGGTLSEAALQTLVDGLEYNNTSATPTLANRVVTITELVDSGTDTGANENTAALSIATTVAVVEPDSLIVTITDDLDDPFDGETSLREAIDFANSDPDLSLIEFDLLPDSMIFLGSLLPRITTAMTIDAEESGVIIDSNSRFAVLDVDNVGSGVVTLDGLTLQNAKVGLRQRASEVEIYNTTIQNTGAVPGGDTGGVVAGDGTTKVVDSTFVNNFASTDSARGAGISTINHTLDISGSTFVGNVAGDNGGAISAFSTVLTVANSTFANNSAPNGAAIYVRDQTATLTNVTITGSVGDSSIILEDSLMQLVNSLFVGNPAGDIPVIQSALAVFAQTNSILGGTASDIFAALDPITGGGALADNGGPVQTVALLDDPNNPALDIGLNPLGLATDADGNPRTIDLPGVGADLMGFVDAGAVELQALGNLTVVIAADDILEADGPGATTGTVTRSGDTSTALVVTLTSNDITEATVPATVTIAIGDASASFDIAAVDDGVTDGDQTVTITATAAAINPGSDTLVVIENLPPTITLDPATLELPEDTDVSSRVKLADVVVADDGIGTNNLSIRGADSGSFELDGTELFLRAGASIDFEREAELSVFVDVDDPAVGSARDDTTTFTLDLTDVNEPPEVLAENVVAGFAEDADTSSDIKVADIEIVDDALGTESLSLSGADAAMFTLVGQELFLTAGAALDFETQDSLSVSVSVDDTTVGATPDNTVDLSFAVTDVNEAPSIEIVPVGAGVPETSFLSGRVKFADVVITDDALGSQTLSLTGPNQFKFQLDGTELFIRAGQSLDFETQNPLEVTVEVDDASLPGVEAFAVAALTLLDVNEAPSLALSNILASLPENTDTTAAIKVADIDITDDALGTNTLALTGADAALFEISGMELLLKAGTALDFETDPQFDVTVTLDDADFAGLEGSEALSLAITDANEPPTVALLNPIAGLAEDTDTSARIKVADIDVTDDAVGTADLDLIGADAALFEIDGSELFLQAGAILDFETNPNLDVSVTVDDPALAADPDDSAGLGVVVTDVNEGPSLALANVVAGLPEDTDMTTRIKVADITVTDDALGTNTLGLIGTDAALFEIDGTELFLQAGTALDFETVPQFDVSVTLDDPDFAGLEGSEAVALAVTDVNELPTVALLNALSGLAEDTDTTARVKIADIDIEDDALGAANLGLTGADAALFEIDGTELFLQAGATLDFETNPSLDVAVTVDDPSLAPDPNDSDGLGVAVTDVNEAPALKLANVVADLPEDTDTTARVKIADITITDDALGTNTLGLTGADAALFEIDGAELFLKAGTSLDFEADDQLDVSVTLDDPDFAGLEGSEAVALAITDVNELPTVALLNGISELAEDSDTNDRVKVADIDVSDDALGSVTLGLIGADAALFEIDGAELFLIAGAALDFEANPSLDVSVTVDDPTLGIDPDDSAVLGIAVTDVNEAPSLALANVLLGLSQETDTTSRVKIADIVITDDALGINALTLTGGDAVLFEIDGTELFLKAGTMLDTNANAVLDVAVNLDDADIGTAGEGSEAVSVAVFDPVETGSEDGELLIVDGFTQTLMGLGGDDTLVGQSSDDIFDGGTDEDGEDEDTVVLQSPPENYTIVFSPDGTTVSDGRPDGTGTDTLIDIETLLFSDDPTSTPDMGELFDLEQISGVVDTTDAQLEALTLLYIGLYDRAPDALGLFYWATQLVEGVDIDAITQAFIDSPEAVDIYGAAPSSSEIVAGAYENILDRDGDALGEQFWTGLLEFGIISPAEFFQLFAIGVELNPGAADDRATLGDQTDIGLYYSVIRGLSDVANAKTALAEYDIDDRAASLIDAQALIDGFATAAAGAGPEGELIIQVTGIVDDPFAVA